MYKQIHFYLNLFACTSTYPNLCVYLQSCFKFKKSLMAPSNVCCFPFLFFLFVGIVSELGIYIKQKHLMNKGDLKSFQGSTVYINNRAVHTLLCTYSNLIEASGTKVWLALDNFFFLCLQVQKIFVNQCVSLKN